MARRQARRGDGDESRQWLSVASALATRNGSGARQDLGTARRRGVLNASAVALGRAFARAEAWGMLGALFAQTETQASSVLAQKETAWDASARPHWVELLKKIPQSESAREALLRPAMESAELGSDSLGGHRMLMKTRLLAAASQAWGSEMAVFEAWPKGVVPHWMDWAEKIDAAATRKELAAAAERAMAPKNEKGAKSEDQTPAHKAARRI
jgi:hypothetical protein